MKLNEECVRLVVALARVYPDVVSNAIIADVDKLRREAVRIRSRACRVCNDRTYSRDKQARADKAAGKRIAAILKAYPAAEVLDSDDTVLGPGFYVVVRTTIGLSEFALPGEYG